MGAHLPRTGDRRDVRDQRREGRHSPREHGRRQGLRRGPQGLDRLPLVDEIVASLSSISPNEFASKEQFQAEAVGQVRAAKETLAAKADPEEVSTYGDFIVTVVKRVAEADKSGGFMGIGGERVTAQETAAIEEIRAALS